MLVTALMIGKVILNKSCKRSMMHTMIMFCMPLNTIMSPWLSRLALGVRAV
jgi:hypothetical protein